MTQLKQPHFYVMILGLVLIGAVERKLIPAGAWMESALLLVMVLKVIGNQLALHTEAPHKPLALPPDHPRAEGSQR
jgi:hypothetical protein